MSEIPVELLLIEREVIGDVLRSRLDRKMPVNADDNACIGGSGEVERWPGFTKNLQRRLFERDHAGTTGIHQCAVDVEEVEHECGGESSLGTFLIGLIFRRIFRHLVVEDFFFFFFLDVFFVVEVIFFHQFSVEEVELALALVLRKR